MATVPGTPQSDTAVFADPGVLRGPDVVLPKSILPKEEQEPPKGEQETLVIDIPAPDRAAQYDDGIDLTDDQDAPLPINIPPVEIERPVDDDISDQFIADYERTMMLDTANEAGLQDGALKDMLSPDKEPVNVQEALDLQGPGEIIGPGPTEEEIQAFTEAAKDLPLSVVGGVFDAIEATVALAQEVLIFLPAHIMGIEVSEEFKKKASDILPDIPQSDSTVNQIVRTLVQFGTGFGVVNVARLAAGVALPAARVARLTVQELQFALGEGLAFPENQARFSNILKQMGFDNALIDALRAPEKGEQAESVILGRTKAALEGFLIGLPFVFIEALAPFIIGVFKSHRAVDEARDRIVDYADEMVETGGEGRRVLQENELLFQQDVETLSRTLNIDKDQAERMMTRAEEMGISLDDIIRNEGGSIREFADRSSAQLARSSDSVGIRSNQQKLNQALSEIKPTGKTGQTTVKDVGAFFDARHKEVHGRKLDPENPEDIQIAVKSASADIKYQLQQAVTGKGWYTKDMEDAFQLAARIPGLESIADNPTHRIILTAMMGPSSNGKSVPLNFKIGAINMEQYLKDGTIPFGDPNFKIPKGLGLGKEVDPIRKNLKLIQDMIDDMGEEGFADFWVSEHTLGELTAIRKKFGLKTGPSKVMGGAKSIHAGGKIIGEKTGNFSLAMNGVDATTKDRWNIRGYHRQFGQTTDAKGLKGITDETGLVDALRGGEGPQMDAFWTQVSKNVGLDERDTQAVMWYYEQFLYNDLGTSSKPRSFSDGAKELLESRGIDNSLDDPSKFAVEGVAVDAPAGPGGTGVSSVKSRAVEPAQTPTGLEGLTDAAILPPRHSPLVTRFIEENKRHLGIPSAGDDPTDIVTNIQRRLQSELEAFGRSAEDKSLAPGDLPSNIETVPLVTIADDPLTVPEISGLARVLADKLGIAPPGTMSIDDLGETAMEPTAYRGGNDLTLTLNPTITDDGFVTVMPHEVGHVVSFRIEEMRRAMLTDGEHGGGNIDDMVERGVQLGTITRDEIEVIQGNRLFDGIAQTLLNINEGMSRKKAENLAMDIASELRQITHSRRHWSWEQAETSDNMLAYMSHPSEILADGIADFMQYPLSVKDVMPNWTAFLKKLVNEDKLISKVIAIASLSGIMLPGLPELAKEVDQSVLGDIDG
jgi:hypothetical protein